MSKIFKIHNGLVINDTQIITGVTDNSGLTNQSDVLPTSNAVKGYIDNLSESKLNLTGGTITGLLMLSDTLYISGLSSGTTDKILYYNTISKLLTYDDIGISSQWTTSGTSIYYNTGNVTIGSNLIYNDLLVLRKDITNGIGASIHLINNNYMTNNNAETEIVFSTSLSGDTTRLKYSKIHNVGTGTFGQVGRLSFGMTDSGDNYQDILNITPSFVGVGYLSDPTSGNKFAVSGNTHLNGTLYISGLTQSSTNSVLYYNDITSELSWGDKPESSFSAITYNIVYNPEISTPGTYTINITTTDIYYVNISGNTQTSIIFDFSNPIIGKSLTMIVTNSGLSNLTECVFSPTTCKRFGFYDATKTNAVSVLCVSTTATVKYWVIIANT